MGKTVNTALMPVARPLSEHQWDPQCLPLVSVVCFAYNHERFIRQCLDGILEQVTDFQVEVVVHDDASQDQTSEIIREYARRYPQLIKPIIRTENLFSKGRSFVSELIGSLKTKYIALCDCDDYWICEFKLQRQVELLEKYSDCSYCATRFLHVYENESIASFPSGERVAFGTLDDILVENYTHTCTLMFRRELAVYPKDARVVHSEDWYICCLLARHGRIGFVNEVMSAYRLHGGGASTGMTLEKKYRTIKATLDEIHRMLEGRYPRLRIRALFNYRLHLAHMYFLRGRRWDWYKACGHLVAAYARCPASAHKSKEMQARLSDLFAPIRRNFQSAIEKLRRLRFNLGALRRAIGLGPSHRND